MKKRFAVIAGLVGALGFVVPVAAKAAAPVPPACVAVNGPNGLHAQVGYAPNGPADCHPLP